MMDILSYVYEFLHKKIYEYLIPYNFLKFYCLKIKSSGNVLVMFGNVLAMFGNVCYNTYREAEQ